MNMLRMASIPIYDQIVWILGKFMNAIYHGLRIINPNIANVGICIILFTITLYILMVPMMVKQQKFTRLSSVMNPEIKKIQEKYKGKRDQVSVTKQQEEMNAVYAKYGTSPTGGCLVSLIQFPILIALYSIVRNIGNYVTGIDNMDSFNRFLGIDVSVKPLDMIMSKNVALIAFGILVPLLAGISQWISIRFMNSRMTRMQADQENPMMNSMKTMNMVMPLFSIYICVTLPGVYGIYWIVSAIVRTIEQIIINYHLDQTPIEEMVEKNLEKAKNKKKSVKGDVLSNMATKNTKYVDESKISEDERNKKLREADQKREIAKKGSLSYKANIVKRFNEGKE